MTLPQQTWRISSPYTIIKSSNLTVQEALTGLVAALGADAANHWEVAGSSLSAAQSWVMIRRKGSPGGILGTFRILLFGGTSAPAQAACQPTVAANRLYMMTCEDAGVDAPDVSPWTGAPFPGKLQALACEAPGALTTIGASTRINTWTFCDCDRMLAMMLRGNGSTDYGSFLIAGEIIERADDGAGVWAFLCGSDATAAIKYPNSTAVQLFPSPSTGTARPSGGYNPGGGTRQIARADFDGYTGTSHQPLFSLGGTGILLPAIAVEGNPSSILSTYTLLGVFRQMRLGPFETGFKYIKDANDNVRAIFMSSGNTALGGGIYFDQNA